MHVGFIGLGAMGKPMARNLLAAGFSLAVYDIAPQAVAELADAGAFTAASPAELAARCDVTSWKKRSGAPQAYSRAHGKADLWWT